MILIHATIRRHRRRIPRESGDDPPSILIDWLDTRYSPRERG